MLPKYACSQMSRITGHCRLQTCLQTASSVSELRYLSRTMSSSCIWEEDHHPDYAVKRYYPARIGETISGRYRIMSKLGWGQLYSLVSKDTNRSVHSALHRRSLTTKRWFWQSPQYVTLKIKNCGKDAKICNRGSANIAAYSTSQISAQGSSIYPTSGGVLCNPRSIWRASVFSF
jgi:hypothetical protein